MILTIETEGEQPINTTLAEFTESNAELSELADVIEQLRKHSRAIIGGGAAPLVVISVALFVVAAIHDGTGTDIGVRRATSKEIAEEREHGEGWAMPYTDAVALAKTSAKEQRCRWFDFSADPAPIGDAS